MKIGSYEIPENRLSTAIIDVKKIYDVIAREEATTADIGEIWGYKKYATGIFYRRLNSVMSFGLLEQVTKGKFRVTDIGESLSHPENDEMEKHSKHKAVLSVPLWAELYEKYQRNVSLGSFWVQLKKITDIDSQKAKSKEKQIMSWYTNDTSHVLSDQLKEQKNSQNSSTGKNLFLGRNQDKQGLDSDMEIISFDNCQVMLPKGDLRKGWQRLQKYMEIKLEDYQYEEPIKEAPVTEDLSDEDIPDDE